MDTSTIHKANLSKLPKLNLLPTYHLQRGRGNGCAGDPPGYPTYFTRSIYTQYGDSPPHGREDMELLGHAFVSQSEDSKRERFFRRLWIPLPLDHPRSRQWIERTYQHFAHCYQDVDKPKYNRPGTLIYPVPSYKLKTATIDEHWTEEYKAIVRLEAETYNRDAEDRAKHIAVPNNHKAVVIIRQYYPAYQPELDLIENPPQLFQADWWEREATRPTQETCPGHYDTKHGAQSNCRYCGMTEGATRQEVAA